MIASSSFWDPPMSSFRLSRRASVSFWSFVLYLISVSFVFVAILFSVVCSS